MNKTEKLICLVLGAVLAWYIFSEMGKAKEAAKNGEADSRPLVSEAQKTNSIAKAEAEASSSKSGQETASPLENSLERVTNYNPECRRRYSAKSGTVNATIP